MQKVANIKIPKLKSLNPIYILVIALLSIIFIGIAYPPLTASAKTTAKMNIGESANSYLYYTALRECILNNQMSHSVNGVNTIIAEVDADKLNWFGANSSDLDDGEYLNKTYDSYNKRPNNIIVDTLHCRGKPSDTIQKALAAWGYSSGTEALCAFGLKRRTIKVSTTTPVTNQTTSNGGNDVDCLTGDPGQDEFYTDSSGKIDVNKFDKAIDEKIGKPVFTSAIKYHLYRQALFTGCLGVDAVANPLVKPTEDTSGDASSSSNKVYTIVDVDDNGDTKTKSYKGVQDKSYQVVFYLTPRSWSVMTCGELEVHANSATLAKAYGDKLKENLKDPEIAKEGSEVAPTDKKGATCGSEMKLLGWIICPIIEGLAGLNDMMFKLIESLLIVNPLTQDSSDSTYIAWGSMRNIANAAFVIAFLIIIFSQMSGAGITNYGIKKLLPKLIVCAILVNLSYLIMQLLVDIANIAGSSIYGALKALTPMGDINNMSWQALVTLSVAGVVGSAGTILGATVVGAPTMLWLLLPIIIAGTLAFIAAFATLVFRRAAIPILAILSPLAFVAFLLPNTESWFKKWKDALTSMLVLYPTAALLFGACYFVSHSMIGNGKDWWNLMMGLVVMALPLFSLPFIAKQGGAILSKVNGALNGAVDKLKKPVNNWTGERAEYASEMSKNRAMSSNRPGLRRAYLRRQAKLDDIKKNQSENFKYEQARYIADETENNADYRRQVARGSGEIGEQRALVNAIKVQNSLEADEITASKVLFKHAGLSGDARQELAMTGSVTIGNKTYSGKAMQIAAVQEQLAAGSIDNIYKIVEATGQHAANGQQGALYDLRQTVVDGIVSNGIAKKDPVLGGSRLDAISQGLMGEIGSRGTNAAGNVVDIGIDTITLKAINSGKYTAKALASMDNEARDRVINIAQNEANNGNFAALNTLREAAATIRASTDLQSELEGDVARDHINNRLA